jgi:mannan endo-1,4-beta-mannosidase
MKMRGYIRWLSLCASACFLACAHPTDDIGSDADAALPTRGGAHSTAGSGGKAGTLSSGGAHTTNVAGGGAASGGTGGGAHALGSDASSDAGMGGDEGAAGGSSASGGSGGSVSVPAELELDLKSGNSAPNDNQIRFAVRVVSSAKSSVALSSLELRYYFTSEVAPPLVIEIYDVVQNGSSGYHALAHDAVKSEVVSAGAESYLKLTMTDAAGNLAASDSFMVDLVIHGQNWTGNFAEADDYSFAPDHIDFSAWDHVTLFGGQKLIWGSEPP